jgi:uncharacterized protein (UPF0332 family)
MNTVQTLTFEERRQLISQQQRKSTQAIEDARLLISHSRFDGALNRLYYALFYAITSVAITQNYGTSKHLQLLGWFNKTILHPGLIDAQLSKLIMQAY